MTKYQISIFAEGLPRVFFKTPSSYAAVTISEGPQQGKEIGRTEISPRDSNPDWIQVLFVETNAATYMPINVEVFHGREYNDDVLLGSASFEVTEIYSSTGHCQSRSLDGRSGTIHVAVHESQKGNDAGVMQLQLRGLDIRNVEPGLLGLGRSDPFVEISKKNADHAAGVVRWNVVHRTNHILDHLNPFWDGFSLVSHLLMYLSRRSN